MLWIFVAVFVISTSINTCESAENLTAIVWEEHKVDTLEKLKTAIESKTVKAFEVDVMYGSYEEPTTPKPDEPKPTSSTETPKPTSSTETPKPTSSTETPKPDSSSTETSKPGSSSTTSKPKPDPNPGHDKPPHPDSKWPIKSEDSEDKPPAKPKDDSEFNFYEVVAEESLPIDATEFKTYDAVVIKQDGGKSNLKFSDFLVKAIEYSKGHEAKSVKLNFHDQKSVEHSVSLILKRHREIKFSIWLHADVIQGPQGKSPKLNAKEFIDRYIDTSKYVLSLGLTTEKASDPKDGYTEAHTKAMKAIVVDNIQKAKIEEPLNVPLRALYVPKSTTVLQNFFNDVKKLHPKFTFSIWSAKDDDFKADEIQNFVKLIGIDNVYLSLAKEQRDKLNLGNGASGLVRFGLLNLVTLAVVTIFRNGLN